MKSVVIFLLIGLVGTFGYSQQVYNACNNAFPVCPEITYSINNINANVTVCPSCEDDFIFCFEPNNSIWLNFTTNEFGGNATLNIFNISFQTSPGQSQELQATFIQANVPCNADSYTQVGNCEPIIGTNFALTATGLLPNTEYYVVITGSDDGIGITSPAEASMDIYLSGPAVNRPPPGLSVGTNSPICQGNAVSANAYVVNCPDTSSYKWYVNGVLTAVTDVDFFLSANIQSGDIISVEVSCVDICDSVTLTASSLPLQIVTGNVDAGPDVAIPEGGFVQLNGQTTSAVYSWSPSFSLTDPTILNPIASPNVTTVYTLTAIESGCTLNDFVTVSVNSGLFFPNTFSPNGDGDNDVWEIVGIENFPNCQLIIYDRWGQIVHQASGYNKQKAWDGTSRKGVRLNDGVYFYEMKLLDDEGRTFKGPITIIR